jgi:hypothetical protein
METHFIRSPVLMIEADCSCSIKQISAVILRSLRPSVISENQLHPVKIAVPVLLLFTRKLRLMKAATTTGEERHTGY